MAVHRSIVVVDVEGYGDLARTSRHRLAAREGMYRVVEKAFAEAGLLWDLDEVDDAGDSLLLLLPADVPKEVLADQLPTRLAAALRTHNAVHADGVRLRMRMALHAGEVHYDEHGKTSAEMIFACRILDAAEAKAALRDSTATLALITSDWFHDSVVRHDPASRPEEFRRVRVEVKETTTTAWLRLVDGHPLATAEPGAPAPRTAPPPPLPLAELKAVTELLLATPGFDTREGRDLVLRDVSFAATARRANVDRSDVVEIVKAAWRYPAGPAELLASLGFHAEGAAALTELERLFRGWGVAG